MADTPSVPSYADLLWPTVKALRALGGSGSITEIVEKVVELEGFTEEQQAVPHGDGPQSQIEYRLAWARSYLKGMGLLDNMAGRGDKGLVITTGSFTGDAKREATRDGAPPIDLIDGDGLCELLKRYELGVKTTVRQVEEVAIHPEFFQDV